MLIHVTQMVDDVHSKGKVVVSKIVLAYILQKIWHKNSLDSCGVRNEEYGINVGTSGEYSH